MARSGTARETARAGDAEAQTVGARRQTSAGRAAPARAATPWGPAAVVEELQVPQRAGDRRFSSIVQLLEGPRGERLVRFAYSTGGVARRGPVTLRERDLERLRAAVGSCPQLARALGLVAGGDA
jgi:hypothetical protein